ncbi:hypothetical protein GCM10011352_21520 [Marinobacterium zhoushanense]|uniref:Uncharacterized protein n=1 Tax=Marinobacterium zhoushanense TaxID=1679163 RepID=A0ABQ1KBW0_9GAMM|nr:hypothetical protein GCM10011352_21520 [Marinobacterium zhoushanense]
MTSFKAYRTQVWTKTHIFHDRREWSYEQLDYDACYRASAQKRENIRVDFVA